MRLGTQNCGGPAGKGGGRNRVQFPIDEDPAFHVRQAQEIHVTVGGMNDDIGRVQDRRDRRNFY